LLLAAQAIGLATALGACRDLRQRRGRLLGRWSPWSRVGAMWALDFPARRTALYTCSAPRACPGRLARDGLDADRQDVGPLAAGVCLAWLGPAASYLIMALVYSAGLLASSGLSGGSAAGRRARRRPWWRACVRVCRRRGRARTVRGVLLVTIAMNTCSFYQHMLPVFARDVLAVGRRAGRARRGRTVAAR